MNPSGRDPGQPGGPVPSENSAAHATFDLHDRRHRLKPPRDAVGKLAVGLKDRFESWIARHSLHGDPAIYEPSEFPWAQRLETNWRVIREELEQVLVRRHEMPNFHDILSQVSTITRDDQWKTYFLIGPGMDCRENQEQCPRSYALLREVPGIQTAMFSILSPHKHIPAHRGPYNGVLRYHLGLVVPEPKEKCRIRIGTETRHWTEGGSLIFDDTFNHEVWNDTDGVRVVLFVDFTRPLRAPASIVNDTLMNLAGFLPFLRAAGARQKEWARRFHGTGKKPA